MVLLGIIVLVIIIPILIYIYNELIRRKNEVINAFGSVDVMLKQRYDLLPNLVEIAKKYLEHEQFVLLEITRLRSSLDKEATTNEKVKDHNELQKKVNSLLMNVENYPELKADIVFISLQANWTSAEEHISASRRYYNSAVTEYNNYIQMFPSNLVAKLFNFNSIQVFDATEEERKNISAKELLS